MSAQILYRFIFYFFTLFMLTFTNMEQSNKIKHFTLKIGTQFANTISKELQTRYQGELDIIDDIFVLDGRLDDSKGLQSLKVALKKQWEDIRVRRWISARLVMHGKVVHCHIISSTWVDW